MKYDDLNEYNVIGSAVRLDEIPPEFRKLKFLGRGATTIAFEKDPTTVLIFTRDHMKIDWLTSGLRLLTNSAIVKPVKRNHIKGMDDVPLIMASMPKLYPLSKENRKKIVTEIKNWISVSNHAREQTQNWGRWGEINKEKFISMVNAKYDEDYPNSLLTPLFSFLLNYDTSQYELDIDYKQFKQTYDGKLVLLDPIVSSELMKLFLQKYS